MAIQIGPETITRVELKNGIVVLIYENHASSSVVVRGHLRAGALFEPKTKPGLAAFTGDVIERGTTTRTFQDIAAQTESVGAAVDVGAGVHLLGFSGKSLSEDLALLLDMLSDIIRNPSFPKAEIEKVRGEILTALKERADSTGAMANLAFRKLAYPNHPYGRDPMGTRDSIEAITRADLKNFYGSVYHPAGMQIVIVGDVRAADAVRLTQKFFGAWQVPHAPPAFVIPPVKPLAQTQRKHVKMKTKVQSDIVLGAPALPRTHPDYLAAMIGDVILGEFGLMGRLGDNVRDRLGLAYSARSQLEAAPGPGAWVAYAGVNPQNVDTAVEALLFEMNRLKAEPVAVAELDDAKDYMTGGQPLRLESNDGIAGAILDMEFYQLGLDHLQHLAERVRAITPAQVQAAAQNYLSTDKYALVVAGP